MPDDLGRDGLHQHNGIGAHALAVMEELGHAEYHYIILLFSPRHIGPLIRRNPGVGLHDFCISAVNLYLTGLVSSTASQQKNFFPMHFSMYWPISSNFVLISDVPLTGVKSFRCMTSGTWWELWIANG